MRRYSVTSEPINELYFWCEIKTLPRSLVSLFANCFTRFSFCNTGCQVRMLIAEIGQLASNISLLSE
jgi:hypothetical protein